MDFVENVGRRKRVKGDNGDFINVGVFSLNGYERNALFENLGNGKLFDVGYPAGADRIEDGRGMATLDADGDGDTDIVICNYLQPARLLINHAPPETHWLRLALRGTRSARSAIGARVMVQHGSRCQFQEVCGTAGYLSGQSLYLHFGLGLDALVDRIVVHWPSGAVQEHRNVPADRFYRLVEGEPGPTPFHGPVDARGRPVATTSGR